MISVLGRRTESRVLWPDELDLLVLWKVLKECLSRKLEEHSSKVVGLGQGQRESLVSLFREAVVLEVEAVLEVEDFVPSEHVGVLHSLQMHEVELKLREDQLRKVLDHELARHHADLQLPLLEVLRKKLVLAHVVVVYIQLR